MPMLANRPTLEAARPQITSARGLSFSAISLAVITPVESRTQAISIVGIVGLEGLLERLELLVLDRRVDRELGLLRERRPR